MLVVALGSHGSGSTWVYNVVLALLHSSGRRTLGGYADDGITALDKLSIATEDGVLKAHSMDLRLFKLASISNAKIITSVRDPLDSVVSLNTRFSSTKRNAIAEISKTFVTISSIPNHISVLSLNYENKFMDNPSTVEEIANFLGLNVSLEVTTDIYLRFTTAAVKNVLSTLFKSSDNQRPDSLTQWYPNHLGDGRIGKWRDHFDSHSLALYKGCLQPLASHEWQKQPLRWLSELYENGSGQFDTPVVALTAPKQPNFLAYGPYLYLPAGRWMATPIIETDAYVPILADVYLPWIDKKLTERVGYVGANGTALALIFEHDDPFQPIETRLQTIHYASARFEFGGWEIRWLSEVSEPVMEAKRPLPTVAFGDQHLAPSTGDQNTLASLGNSTLNKRSPGALKRMASKLTSIKLCFLFRNYKNKSSYQIIKDSFDQDFYLENYPDVRMLGIDPVIHYIAIGHDAGYNPSSAFCTVSYLIRYPDVADAGINAFEHYLKFGKAEQRDGRADIGMHGG